MKSGALLQAPLGEGKRQVIDPDDQFERKLPPFVEKVGAKPPDYYRPAAAAIARGLVVAFMCPYREPTVQLRKNISGTSTVLFIVAVEAVTPPSKTLSADD